MRAVVTEAEKKAKVGRVEVVVDRAAEAFVEVGRLAARASVRMAAVLLVDLMGVATVAKAKLAEGTAQVVKAMVQVAREGAA